MYQYSYDENEVSKTKYLFYVLKFLIYIIFLFHREIQEGVPVEDETGKRVGKSKAAAREGISLVTMSRVCMALPGMGKLLLYI